jgi:hypothetical protein
MFKLKKYNPNIVYHCYIVKNTGNTVLLVRSRGKKPGQKVLREEDEEGKAKQCPECGAEKPGETQQVENKRRGQSLYHSNED